MVKLPETLRAWGTDRCAHLLKREILALKPGTLPLHLATKQGGMIQGGARDLTVLAVEDDGNSLLAHIGVFFTEVVGGCSCGDEPLTVDSYCELKLRIDKRSAEADLEVV
jgi:hypothetical protein